MSRSPNARTLLLLGALFIAALSIADAAQYGFGRPPTAAEIAGWNIDVNGLTGKGLPPGSGSVSHGEQVFSDKCASCHGDFGEGNGRMPVLAGGRGTLASARPIETVGSYWPYAPTLFDYIRRAMPFPNPESLSNDDVYAVTAYILYLNDVVPKTASLDARSLAAIKMPNRNGFIAHDVRPDVHNVACMHRCKPGPVKVTSDLARQLGVTPVAAATAAAVALAPVSFVDAQRIVQQRCVSCHAAHPTQPGFTSAPAGVMLDTPERIVAAAKRIEREAVTTQAMPLGNMTHMTAEERALLGRWIESGAKTQ
jgi:mono/diheme cytochrome c family protein